MALTKIGKEGITGISNSANANAITIDSGENVALSGTLGVTGAITGTLATAAQTNITSVGTLTSFRSTGIDDNADALAITINSSENVGIGVVPETTWNSNIDALQLGLGASIYGDNTATGLQISANTVATLGSSLNGYKYIGSDKATTYQQYDGQHNFRVASSGSADGAITWTTALTINNSGNVGIGETSPAAPLHIESGTTTDIMRFGTNGRWGFQRANSDSRYLSLSKAMNGSSSSVLAIDGDNSHVGLGVTTPSTRLHIRSAVASSIAGYRDGTTGLIVEGDGASYIQIIASKTNPMGILFDGGNTHNDTSRGAMLYDIDYGLAFKSGGAVRWKIDEAGDIIPYSTSSGIVLGSTSNVAANTLDDYEEGTWTPTADGGSTTYHDQYGFYTKIGRLVYAKFNIRINNYAGSVGYVLGNLPFTSMNVTGSGGSGTIFYWGNLANVATFIGARVDSNVSSVYISASFNASTSMGNINHNWAGNNAQLIGHVLYHTA